MANDKTKQEKELTVEERLKALYELQAILTEIDRVRTIRGELPREVQDLEDDIAGLNTRLENIANDIAKNKADIEEQHAQIDKSNALIERYSEQQNNVRNNKEFDFLSKEIEYQSLNIQAADNNIGDCQNNIERKQAEMEETRAKVDDLEHILAEKKSELTEIVSETKQDEERLRDQAKNLEVKIEPRLLAAFKRIRKNARNGLGIVYIQRNACGGCFNRIPPQRQLEIKMHKKIIVCEYCGRILIYPELAGVEPEVPATAK